ncbi:HAMP domain-containing protein [Kineococcus indalonis]|uniref:HAMP domain-containing protein n=1 Tax=Kineococcus indalonis TaxID=2696566 RepID=UPI00141221E5|nr:methyl-accepting chemotaxis protein [Kineococcus indalonis]NAZ85816.1 HAMP domain-containing protein [Kineococcus indalonis]
MLTAEVQRAEAALTGGHEFTATVRDGQELVVALLVASLAVAVAGALVVRRSIVAPLHRVTDVLWHVAEGDLTVAAGIDSRDELGEVARALDHTTGRFRDAVQRITGSAARTAEAAEQVHSAAGDLQELVATFRC